MGLLEEIKQQREMVKKSQLRRYTVDKLMSLVEEQVDGQTLALYNQTLGERNEVVIEKRKALREEIESIRDTVSKMAFDINDFVKDRLAVKHRLIMDKRSRPDSETMGEVNSLFTFLERQKNLTKRGYRDIDSFKAEMALKKKQLEEQRQVRAQTQHLDDEFERLAAECAKEEKVRDALVRERDEKRRHYAGIGQEIEDVRVEYERVEEQIRNAEREMIQLDCYLQRRQQEDKQTLGDLRAATMSLENELLKAQTICNFNFDRCEELKIKEIEVHSR